jgi:hypothetical protein
MYACAHPQTYKYFFPREVVEEVWGRLSETFGPVQRNDSFRVMEIASPHFTVRATYLGNPITVIRRRTCTEEHVRALHAVMRYDGE